MICRLAIAKEDCAQAPIQYTTARGAMCRISDSQAVYLRQQRFLLLYDSCYLSSLFALLRDKRNWH